jgi:hypothetical protein
LRATSIYIPKISWDANANGAGDTVPSNCWWLLPPQLHEFVCGIPICDGVWRGIPILRVSQKFLKLNAGWQATLASGYVQGWKWKSCFTLFLPKRPVFLTKRDENLMKRIASCLANVTHYQLCLI